MDFKHLIDSRLDHVGKSGRDDVYRCICEKSSSSGHLYVNYKKGFFHCFRCGIAGKNLNGLLSLLGIHVENAKSYPTYLLEPNKDLDKVFKTLNEEAKENVAEYSSDLLDLTSFYLFQTQPLTLAGWQYLRGRGLSDTLIQKLQIVEGLNRKGQQVKLFSGRMFEGKNYGGRILVPSLKDEGRISFFVARDYLKRDYLPKYVNPPSELAYASEDVWNLDYAAQVSRSVIICEGVFTAIAAGGEKMNAVATYGKSIAEKSSSDIKVKSQGEKLLEKKFDQYIVAYDVDAFENTIATCEYLSCRGANVRYLRIPPEYGKHADVSDLPKEVYLQLLLNARPYDSYSRFDLLGNL